MNMLRRTRIRAFSLVELVIVVVIIGIIGAIAIPRLSRGSANASENALRGDLAVLRRAIELYAAEHDNTFPTDANIVTQLTLFSDIAGNTNAAKSSVFMFGPYIKEMPKLPVGAAKGNAGVATTAGAGVGWIYTGGNLSANTTALEVDGANVKFNLY
ncbi:MAG: prepilin-type N-terminal cleavage/methylation domain-containing protein [Phycisphaerales bacterium]|nr:prepilin-type N-terminal cleavage/methylation domain-containing protein [Phycisphaerales bacterium]